MMSIISDIIQEAAIAVLQKILDITLPVLTEVANLLTPFVYRWNSHMFTSVPITKEVSLIVVADESLVERIDFEGYGIKVSTEGRLDLQEPLDTVNINVSLVKIEGI